MVGEERFGYFISIDLEFMSVELKLLYVLVKKERFFL